ncbi:class II aldolase/adducin family protein [Mitsuaria sp. GD03876]|uniref:class II aldolase/adducin family protein n=1 Tax=Mitsuaria sp. GD03876 TaxID=2975399 RepID=UPI0024493368|nr:class II aldolase/adducin family protein [Mitsuaria sp. GD03876]MDH0863941.1 class II aldolase/adducin family protein [Mitsuaria sp. GD03876]
MNHADARRHVVDLCLRLSERGYFAGTGGNLMLRIDPDLVAVTPSATDYLAMRPEDVCVLRLADLSVVDDASGGARKPSVETGLHARVLRARPDVGCSIHTHQPLASACALIGEPLAVPRALRHWLGEDVPVVGYAPSGTSWLAGKLARAVRRERQAYLLRNHGILCCAADSATALEAVEHLEALARDLLATRIDARTRREPALRLPLAAVRDLLIHPKGP